MTQEENLQQQKRYESIPVEAITPEDFIAWRLLFPVDERKNNIKMTKYTDTFKLRLIQWHHHTGHGFGAMEALVFVSSEVIRKWKRQIECNLNDNPTLTTGFIHGKRIRYDVRTKAMIVKEALLGIPYTQLSARYNINSNTIGLWKRKYQDRLEELCEAPDGIPYIVAEQKMIYGQDNINKVMELLREQHETLMNLVTSMNLVGRQADLMRECAEESLVRAEEVQKAADTLRENGIDV